MFSDKAIKYKDLHTSLELGVGFPENAFQNIHVTG